MRAFAVLALVVTGCSDSTSPSTSVDATSARSPSTTGAPFVEPPVAEVDPWERPEINTNVDGAIRIEPGDSLLMTVRDSPPGSTFVIAAGRHVGQSVTPRSGDVFLGEEGAILDGDFSAVYAISAHDMDAPVRDVVISGITFERYATPPQLGTIGGGGGNNWLMEGNEVRYSRGGGIEIGSGSIVRNNYVHHNEQIGLHIGSRTRGVLVEGNEIAFNNFEDQYDMAWEAGGAKFVFTEDLVVRKNYVHDNRGAGLWTDGDNIGTIYEGNVVMDNAGPGIFHEISYSAEIRGNHVVGNASDFYFGGILVANSSNVTVTGNVLESNFGGIFAVQDDRGEGDLGPYVVENLVVEGNLTSLDEGWSGLRRNTNDYDPALANVSFEGNKYVSDEPESWFWIDQPLEFAEWQALGFDDSGIAEIRSE